MQLTLAVWFTGLCAIIAGGFVAWLLWSICWDAYDHLMGLYKRRKNTQFDARVGRDCYRFVKGVHHR